MSSKRTCVGFDVGRSAVKMVVRGGDGKRHELIFPSVFAPAVRINDEREADRAALETVQVEGRSYFVGETATIQGRDDIITGLSDDWALTVQHSALFLAGMKKLEQAKVPKASAALVVVGLPARMYAAQKAKYAEHLAQLAPHAEIKVVPQSMGPYHTMMFDAHGNEADSFDAEGSSWGVIEVGHYTTDFALVDGGRTVENGFGSCEGMRVAAENLQKAVQASRNIKISFGEATNALAKPELKDFGKTIDVSKEVAESVEPLALTVLNKANQLFGDRIRRLDGIRLAGGGAPLLEKALKQQWSNVSIAENSRFAVAEGFCRFALGLENFRQAQEV